MSGAPEEKMVAQIVVGFGAGRRAGVWEHIAHRMGAPWVEDGEVVARAMAHNVWVPLADGGKSVSGVAAVLREVQAALLLDGWVASLTQGRHHTCIGYVLT